MNLTSLIITPELLKLITEIDEFKGSWKQIGENNPDQLVRCDMLLLLKVLGRLRVLRAQN